MSAEKDKLNELAMKVDKILKSLSDISEEIHSVSASLKSLSGGQVAQPPAAQPPTPNEVSVKLRTIDEIRMSFPEELEARLGFEDKGEYIIIKPKMFLGSENFAKIASAVRGMGGEYISAGKDSHFRVPKKKV